MRRPARRCSRSAQTEDDVHLHGTAKQALRVLIAAILADRLSVEEMVWLQLPHMFRLLFKVKVGSKRQVRVRHCVRRPGASRGLAVSRFPLPLLPPGSPSEAEAPRT